MARDFPNNGDTSSSPSIFASRSFLPPVGGWSPSLIFRIGKEHGPRSSATLCRYPRS